MQANIEAFEKELKCPICSEYVVDAVTPPCDHLFCRKCIVLAIERKSTCPVCGAAIQSGESLEPQPWTKEAINLFRLTLQELFRDRESQTEVAHEGNP
jgi:C4-type Zn-finger protein